MNICRISELFKSLLNLDYNREFKLGFLAGIVIFLVLALLVRIIFIFIITSRRRCPGILMPTSQGSIFVSTAAIADLIEKETESFAHVKIYKTHLLREDNSISIELIVAIRFKDEKVVNMLEQMQLKILDSLKERLGIDRVKSVNIRIRKFHSE